ncbi:cupin domain-containing protein [Aliikangiella sp. G2MR2-5]|uniref:cupin domain-containing protein n=1 Tax=Aliikangiella sp. G2MR2-5 TaxID=2788943 RepID=UPI0018AA5A62|nr:cupin domain-containing protein [Aliikangiella sp. G2MR2-5]
MKIKSTKNTEHYIWGENCDGWHLAKSQNLSIIQERVPAGSSEIRHLHQRAEQFFFVLSGTATLEIKGIEYQLHPEQGIHVPANTPHQLINRGTEELIFLVTSTPPAKGDRVAVPN